MAMVVTREAHPLWCDFELADWTEGRKLRTFPAVMCVVLELTGIKRRRGSCATVHRGSISQPDQTTDLK